MPSIFTPAIVSAALSVPFRNTTGLKKRLIAGICCGMLPDADALGYFMGVPYDSV